MTKEIAIREADDLWPYAEPVSKAYAGLQSFNSNTSSIKSSVRRRENTMLKNIMDNPLVE